jgi:hypothetical protein
MRFVSKFTEHYYSALIEDNEVGGPYGINWDKRNTCRFVAKKCDRKKPFGKPRLHMLLISKCI